MQFPLDYNPIQIPSGAEPSADYFFNLDPLVKMLIVSSLCHWILEENDEVKEAVDKGIQAKARFAVIGLM